MSNEYEKDIYESDKKGGVPTAMVTDDPLVASNATEDPHMHRSLQGRHVSMIAIAGTIGTGLFLSSGRALSNGGTVGAVLGYTIVGLLVGCMMFSLGEMMVYDPSAGGFIEFSTRYVDPAMGFAMGWQFWFQTALTAPTEAVAASIVIQYWDHNSTHLAGYITAILAGTILINFAGVRYFGEFEFWFAFVKIITIFGLAIFNIVVSAGGTGKGAIGFRYYKEVPFNSTFLGIDPPAKARFLGWFAVLTQATFSYGGMEGLASICLEAHNPRRTMRTAVRAIFYRIVLLYVITLFFVGMCLSPKDPNLLQAINAGSGTAAQSPFVIIVKNSGVKALDSIINAVILTSAFSSGNEFLYASSRSLFMLSQEGKAPKMFSKILKNGVPVYALGFTALFSTLAYLTCGSGKSNEAFTWLGNITTLGSQITWIGIGLSHIRFYNAMKLQGVPRSSLPFTSFIQPYGSYAVVISFSVIIFFQGWVSFNPTWNASNFFSSYINLPIFALLFLGWKLYKKTKFVSLAEMDVTTHYVEGSVVLSRLSKEQ